MNQPEKTTEINIGELAVGFDFSEFEVLNQSREDSAKERFERFAGPLLQAREAALDLELFADVSLERWIDLAKKSGVDFVPGEVICRIPVDTIMNFEEPNEEDAKHWAALSEAVKSLESHEMLRWDCCAGSDVKSLMHHGQDLYGGHHPLNEKIAHWQASVSPDDPRLFDIAYTYPGEDIAVIRRPWVEARTEGSHPAEYRVFVRNGEVEGVANYYIQRDLPLNEMVMHEVAEVISAAQRMLDGMGVALPFNDGHARNPGYFEPGKVHCTMDFLVDKNIRTLFLEAGPAFGLGAHPCAFMNNKTDDGRISVSGVALGVNEEPLEIEHFKKKILSCTKKARP